MANILLFLTLAVLVGIIIFLKYQQISFRNSIEIIETDEREKTTDALIYKIRWFGVEPGKYYRVFFKSDYMYTMHFITNEDLFVPFKYVIGDILSMEYQEISKKFREHWDKVKDNEIKNKIEKGMLVK